ncbi:3-oxoacyl-ACP synthase [Nocardia cyriacigeorgica]|uniref:3-oxoacyl-ACP synthase n=1 Tax=Nocardia cyriacigeorgica TaxID=135487 RepID=UPI002458459D|nr:3-oxoacyl-ACP synthase [Nocardia cyriacigeorgica]
MTVTLGPVALSFPETSLAVTELAELAELTPARRAHALALGIDRVRCADSDDESEHAARAAAAALEQAGLDASELDALLLVGGRAPKYLLASDATRLQHRLGARNAFVAGVGELGCVSISAAFTMAAALLRGDEHCRNVLVVAGARTPTRARYRAPMTVLGDGGGAVLLGKDGGRYELVDHLVRSDGRYADLFRIDYRGGPDHDWVEECADEATYSFRLAVESRKRLAQMSADVLGRNGNRLDGLDAVLMQNLSVGAFGFWEEALEVRIDRACHRNLADYGHLGSLDMLVNLESASATLVPGEHALLLNSSPVAAWSTSLLRRLPTRTERVG